ncbi:SPOR domain-containing protein [Histidinibacterium lentulum]|uniref:SPOR domain-containing protein n=1 Tax=Histidinibacterium lentulum TaxID=2480588 RepID=A0A3N2QTP1_9RHOB|nr:SPOR domain-containing protein [Histidinibacterium lentulum]ROT98563.1 SPOR domain-containing protein [Histidinibacterium lentulum]
MTGKPTGFRTIRSAAIALAAATVLSGCADGQFQLPEFATRALERPAGDAPATSSAAVELIERDVEAPEVFQVTEDGLWDGRPSLGGVWVAHPDVTEPERVIIRNRDNGQFVIGALFRRERENPGPRLQISSDAAEALGVLAGAPTNLNVTALRRESTPGGAPELAGSEPGFSAESGGLAQPASVETMSLEPAGAEPSAESIQPDPIAAAAAAIESAAAQASAQVGTRPPPAAAPVSAPAASSLDRPYVQIGIFSVEENATRTADRMRETGIVPTVLSEQSQGRAFWRVIVGPARDDAERAELISRVQGQGFADAYAVRN